MSKTQIDITIETDILQDIDSLVEQNLVADRSALIEAAIRGKLRELRQNRLAEECKKLDPIEERNLAEEAFHEVMETWPAY